EPALRIRRGRRAAGLDRDRRAGDRLAARRVAHGAAQLAGRQHRLERDARRLVDALDEHERGGRGRLSARPAGRLGAGVVEVLLAVDGLADLELADGVQTLVVGHRAAGLVLELDRDLRADDRLAALIGDDAGELGVHDDLDRLARVRLRAFLLARLV